MAVFRPITAPFDAFGAVCRPVSGIIGSAGSSQVDAGRIVSLGCGCVLDVRRSGAHRRGRDDALLFQFAQVPRRRHLCAVGHRPTRARKAEVIILLEVRQYRRRFPHPCGRAVPATQRRRTPKRVPRGSELSVYCPSRRWDT